MPKWNAIEAATLLELRRNPDEIATLFTEDKFKEYIEATLIHFYRFGLIPNLEKEYLEARSHSPIEWIDCFDKFPDGRKALADAEPSKPMKGHAENSYIATIAALLTTFKSNEIPSGKDLEKAANTVGIKISDDTIRSILEKAQKAMGLSGNGGKPS